MKFSIIIPCYKVEKYMSECLDSVLAQGFRDWEAICVDDGSPDDTGKILDAYAEKDSRIRVIHQPNGGLSAARNAALDVAAGEWLYYLDSDDLMAPGALLAVADAIAANPEADMIWCGMVRFKDGTQCPWRNGSGASTVSEVSATAFERYFTSYFQRYFYRRSVHGGIRFVGESWCEERPYFAKCMARSACIVELDVLVMGFREREGSITHTKMTQSQCTGYLEATIDMMRTLSASGKTLEPRLTRLLLTKWMEVSPRYLMNHISPAERPTVWKHWFDSLDEAARYPGATPWRRFSIAVCRALPFRATALAVCLFPDWLKRLKWKMLSRLRN